MLKGKDGLKFKKSIMFGKSKLAADIRRPQVSYELNNQNSEYPYYQFPHSQHFEQLLDDLAYVHHSGALSFGYFAPKKQPSSPYPNNH